MTYVVQILPCQTVRHNKTPPSNNDHAWFCVFKSGSSIYINHLIHRIREVYRRWSLNLIHRAFTFTAREHSQSLFLASNKGITLKAQQQIFVNIAKPMKLEWNKTSTYLRKRYLALITARSYTISSPYTNKVGQLTQDCNRNN